MTDTQIAKTNTAASGNRLPAPAPGTARDLLQTTAVRQRFEQVLGTPTKAAQFIASLSTLVYANKALKECEPNTIIAAAVKAAALDLSIDPSLGHAHIVPYKGKATFQIGWKGLVQLALRTGQYALLNVDHTLEGEVRSVNRFTGAVVLGEAISDKQVGVVAYLRMVNGFEKYIYWTLERIHAHAKQYSPSYAYASSGWKTSTAAMEKKTVLRNLLTNWGMLSIEMKTAIARDEDAVIDNEPVFTAADGEQQQRAADSLWGRDDAEREQAAQAAGTDQAPTPADVQVAEMIEEADAADTKPPARPSTSVPASAKARGGTNQKA